MLTLPVDSLDNSFFFDASNPATSVTQVTMMQTSTTLNKLPIPAVYSINSTTPLVQIESQLTKTTKTRFEPQWLLDCYFHSSILYSGYLLWVFYYANFAISNTKQKLKLAHNFGSLYLLCISCCGYNNQKLQVFYLGVKSYDLQNAFSYNEFLLYSTLQPSIPPCRVPMHFLHKRT